MAPAKATLEVIRGENKGLSVVTQFNPQNLRVNYHVAGSPGTKAVGINFGKQGVPLQQTGYTADVTMELLFDTSQEGKDVRNKTLDIARMIQPQGKGQDKAPAPPVPVVRFSWGTFIFTGAIQSMTETLDFFSEQGMPLRATVNLTMIELELERASGGGIGGGLGFSASAGFSAGVSLSAGAAVGTTPLTLSQSGDTLQSLAGRAGVDASWKAIASANNIDNPRLMEPGTVLNLQARAQATGEINVK